MHSKKHRSFHCLGWKASLNRCLLLNAKPTRFGEFEMSNSRKPMRAVRGISQSLCIVLLLLTCGSLSAQNNNEDHHVGNIVLVDGAWADGSGWKAVCDIQDGYNASIVQEPETSFADDVAATKRVLAQQDGRCILVAHSYGGAVITEAGTDPSVVGLVYIAAHMPDAGEKESDDESAFRATSPNRAP
jgi:pimeloyl-ACP methyl ester carboxylesterase